MEPEHGGFPLRFGDPPLPGGNERCSGSICRSLLFPRKLAPTVAARTGDFQEGCHCHASSHDQHRRLAPPALDPGRSWSTSRSSGSVTATSRAASVPKRATLGPRPPAAPLVLSGTTFALTGRA